MQFLWKLTVFPRQKAIFQCEVSFCYILKIFTFCLVEDSWFLVSPSASSLLCVVFLKSMKRMAPPIRTRTSFPLSQSLPSGSFHKPLILLHQRADRMKTTITEN